MQFFEHQNYADLSLGATSIGREMLLPFVSCFILTLQPIQGPESRGVESGEAANDGRECGEDERIH